MDKNKVVVVSLDGLGSVYPLYPEKIELHRKDRIILEADSGLLLGTVKSIPADSALISSPSNEYRILRKATDEDLMQVERNVEKGNEAFKYCQETTNEMKLSMKLVNVNYLFDGSKIVFNFTADERVDFRELVKNLAGRFHRRVEMRQIGVRDEAKIKGGIGICGRVLCCSTWINRFDPVSVKMAKVQGLSLNPTNISGMCGRLMCCLSYEYQNYVDGLKPSFKIPPSQMSKEKKETPIIKNLQDKDRKVSDKKEFSTDPDKKSTKQISDEKDINKSRKRPRRRKRKKRLKGKKTEE